MKIGGVDYNNSIMLAPLAGVTDIGMRHLARLYGADLTTTEMISAKGFVMQSEGTADLLRTDELENPVAVQLFGFDPFVFKDACADPRLDKFSIIDINMGCPVKKVTKTGAGAGLSKHIDRAATIVSVAKSATNKPITVKFRLGWDDNSRNFVDFGKTMQDAGAAAVTLHARTAVQGYEGVADWTEIARLRNALDIPVVANGDVVDKKSYDEIRRVTGCGGVMIGRGAMGRPWIFDELKGKDIGHIDVLQAIRTHISMLREIYDERFTVVNMRHHLGWYLKGYDGARDARRELNMCVSIDEMLAILERVQF